MDEIAWMKQMKKAVIVWLLAVWGFVGFWEIISLIGLIVSPRPFDILSASVPIFIAFALSVFIVLIYGSIYIYHKIVYRKKPINPLSIQDYRREIPTDYPPALLSLIHDLKTDVFRDYSATILFLCNKKYLKLVTNNNQYDFEILKNENELSELSRHEKYVFRCIETKVPFDENEFKNLIIQDAYTNNLLTHKKNKTSTTCIVIFILVLLLIFITKTWKYFILFLFVYIFNISIFIKLQTLTETYVPSPNLKMYKRTKQGKELAIVAGQIKHFLKDYTLIQEKDVEHIKLLDDYIPYALSLNEATSIDEFIKNNEQYRYLIYNFRI